jgi:hypothetical protein
LFPWAKFRRKKGAVKLHTLLDLLPIEPGAFYAMDRGYVDYERLYRFAQGSACFVTRDKCNLDYTRRQRRAVDKTTGLSANHLHQIPKPLSLTTEPCSTYSRTEVRNCNSCFSSMVVLQGIIIRPAGPDRFLRVPDPMGGCMSRFV